MAEPQEPTYEDLEHRLAEAQSIIEALRSQQVDAVVGECDVSLVRLAEMENALRESQARLAQIAESITEVFWLVTADLSEVLYVSPAYEQIWRLSCESLYQQPRSFLDAVHPEDLPALQADMQRRLSGELSGDSEVEYRIIRPDGSEHWIQSRQSPVHDKDGRVVRLAGVSRDITRQKQTEESLRSAEQKLQGILDTATDFILLLDVDGTILEINRMLPGQTRDDVIGASAFDFEDRPALREAMERVRDTRSPVEFENQATGPNGTVAWYRCRLGPTLENSELVGFTLCGSDITEQKQAEDLLNALERQQATVAELGQLALSHVDRQELFDEAVVAVAETLDANCCKVLELLPDGKALLLRAGVGWNDGYVGHARVDADRNSQAGYTLMSEEPVIVEDLSTETRFNGPELLTSHGVVSGMSAVIDGYGVLGVHTKEKRLFTPDDTNFMTAVANLLSEFVRIQRSEETLRDSETLYRTILEAAPQIIWQSEADGSLSYVNQACENIIGMTKEEALGSGWTSVIHPDDAPELLATWERAYGQGEPYSAECRLRRKDGSYRAFDCVGMPVRNASGEIVRWVGIDTDITERKLAEEEIRASRKRLQDIIDSMFAFVGLYTPDGTLIEANRAPLEAAGLQRDDVLGKPFWETYWWSYSPEVQSQLKEALRRAAIGETVRYDVPVRVKDGELVTIDVTFGPLYDDSGNVVQLIGSAVDITERKQAEEELRDAEAKLRSITDASPDHIMLLDLDANILFINRTVSDVTMDEIIGTSVYSFFPSEFHASMRECYARVRATGQPDQHEVDYVGPDGNVRSFESRVAPVIHGGQVAAFSVIAQDISDRKRLEQQRRDLAALVEASPDFVAIANLNQEVLYVNSAGREMVGLTDSDESRGSMICEYHSESERIRYKEELIPELLERGYWRGEVAFRHFETGAELMVEGHTFCINDLDTDKPVAVATVCRDISERKQHEREREELIRQLEQKNAELERYAYTVSHDLKSPLVTIQGFLGLLQKDIDARDNERTQNDVERIRAAANKMQLLLSNLLDLSRVGRVMGPPEEASLTDLAREAVDLVSGQIAEHGVQVDISPGLPIVYGDRARLLEVLQNLIENAIRFRGEQPKPRIEIGLRNDGEDTVCYVRDNGIGIEPRYHEKIFGLFDKLDPQSDGTGIGLALVKRIIETHGGRVSVESEGRGHGCTFCFTIPTKTD